jgi:SAM-dependent methyltransferase
MRAMPDVVSLRKIAGRVDRVVPWQLAYRGDRVECPCCGGRFRGFRPRWNRPDVRCPRCNAYERHRALWLYLRERTNIFTDPVDVLHIAPEEVLEGRLRALPRVRYVGGDLRPIGAQVRIDLMAIPFEDGSFDFVICNHVLDEVPDDLGAIAEMHRVLRPGGRLITQNPVDRSRERTVELAALSTEERATLVGGGAPEDVRRHGRDIAERLAEPGFDVERIDYAQEVGPARAERHGLVEHGGRVNGSDIYVALKRG